MVGLAVKAPQPCDAQPSVIATSLLVPNSVYFEPRPLKDAVHTLWKTPTRTITRSRPEPPVRPDSATLPSLPNFPTARNYIGRATRVNIVFLAASHCRTKICCISTRMPRILSNQQIHARRPSCRTLRRHFWPNNPHVRPSPKPIVRASRTTAATRVRAV